jgi:hypothetical protein
MGRSALTFTLLTAKKWRAKIGNVNGRGGKDGGQADYKKPDSRGAAMTF